MELISCTAGKQFKMPEQWQSDLSRDPEEPGEVTPLKVDPGVSQSSCLSRGLQYSSSVSLPLDFLWIARLKLWQAGNQ